MRGRGTDSEGKRRPLTGRNRLFLSPPAHSQLEKAKRNHDIFQRTAVYMVCIDSGKGKRVSCTCSASVGTWPCPYVAIAFWYPPLKQVKRIKRKRVLKLVGRPGSANAMSFHCVQGSFDEVELARQVFHTQDLKSRIQTYSQLSRARTALQHPIPLPKQYQLC